MSNENSRSSPASARSPTMPSELIDRPFEVRVEGRAVDRFYDVRDAIACARAAKRAHQSSAVIVIDIRTEKPVFDLEA